MLCVACTGSAFEAEQQKNVENCNRILKEDGYLSFSNILSGVSNLCALFQSQDSPF